MGGAWGNAGIRWDAGAVHGGARQRSSARSPGTQPRSLRRLDSGRSDPIRDAGRVPPKWQPRGGRRRESRGAPAPDCRRSSRGRMCLARFSRRAQAGTGAPRHHRRRAVGARTRLRCGAGSHRRAGACGREWRRPGSDRHSRRRGRCSIHVCSRHAGGWGQYPRRAGRDRHGGVDAPAARPGRRGAATGQAGARAVAPDPPSRAGPLPRDLGTRLLPRAVGGWHGAGRRDDGGGGVRGAEYGQRGADAARGRVHAGACADRRHIRRCAIGPASGHR